MRCKKIIATIGLSLVLATLGACGSKTKQEEKVQEKKMDQALSNLSEDDVVSEEETVVDGEKMVSKKLKDGSEIVLPKGTSLDDLNAASENGQLILEGDRTDSDKGKDKGKK